MRLNNSTQILDFLLTADFTNNSGYSYIELLEFLKYYKVFYRQLDIERSNMKRELQERDKILTSLTEKIKKLEERIESQEKCLNNLKTHFARKLTLWERITGKLKI